MERTTDTGNGKKKGTPKYLLMKTWRKCLSMKNVGRRRNVDESVARTPKSRSWPRGQVTAEGCFSVYVGPEKEKYVIRMECLNHPMFKTLLDEAEMEYGYDIHGPLELPCDVAHFKNVMSEMERGEDYYDPPAPTCNFAYNGYQLLSPTRRVMAYQCR